MIKLENKLLSLIQALKIKLFEELQDYKVKSVFETERLQDCIYLKGRVIGLQDYKRGRITKVFLRGRGLSSFWELEP